MEVNPYVSFTVGQDRNQGGAQRGRTPLEKNFPPTWKNVLDILKPLDTV